MTVLVARTWHFNIGRQAGHSVWRYCSSVTYSSILPRRALRAARLSSLSK